MPLVLMVLFLFVSFAFICVFDDDPKERYAANAIIDQSVKEHLSAWSQKQPDKEWAKSRVNNYYSCLGMRVLMLKSASVTPTFCMPGTKDFSFKLAIKNAVMNAKTKPKYKEERLGFFNDPTLFFNK
ncbi:hypothetical protein D3C87_1844440 [compost metagenome]